MLDFCMKRDRKSMLNHQLLLRFRFPRFTRFSSIDGGFYVRKFKNSKVKEVSFYSKLSLEFPEELRMYRCGDLSVVQDCFKIVSVAVSTWICCDRKEFHFRIQISNWITRNPDFFIDSINILFLNNFSVLNFAIWSYIIQKSLIKKKLG